MHLIHMSTSIFFHIAIMNNYQSIVDEIVDDVSRSGLYNIVDNIVVGVVGGHKKSLNTLPDKYQIKFESHILKLYEKPTLSLLQDHAVKSEGNVLYIHTKNARTTPVSRERNYKSWKSWASREVHRKYMLNFNVSRYAERLEDLVRYDTVGCDFRNKPENTSHFAGNYWWATTKFIKTLPSWHETRFPISGPMGRSPRHYCERWLLCYNNKDNTFQSPRYKCTFWGGECRKNDGIINNILSKGKDDINIIFNDFQTAQQAGKFRITI